MLIRLVAQKDQAAYVRLANGITLQLKAIGFAITGNMEDAKDVVQETLLTIATKAYQFRDGQNGWGWVRKIAINYSRKIYKRNKKSHCSLDSEDLWDEFEEDRIFECVLVHEIFQTLTHEEQVLLMMKFWFEMPYREIASCLHRPLGSTYRMMENLMRKIKDNFGEEIINENESKN